MKTNHLALGALVGALLLTGCGDGKVARVKDFAGRFGQFASRDERDSILAYYPGAEYAEKIDLPYSPDSLSVAKGEKENTFVVNYGNAASMLVSLSDDGRMEVVESRGLFKYPDSKMKFAGQVGALHSDMTDEKLAKAMIIVDNISSELFKDFVASRKNAVKNLGYTVTTEVYYGTDLGEGYYTLKNTTDQPIGGDEYTTTWRNDYMHMGVEDHSTEIQPGKDIPARGSVQLPFTFTLHGGSTLIAVTMTTPTQESFFKNYVPKGDEYAAYVRVHGDDPGKAERLSYGPYTVAGKLGGKYAIHMTLDKGMKRGTYYYDKNGPKNTLDLSVKAFNDRTGELIIEETNDKGEVTGTFTGTLTPDAYTGTMTSFQGKSYDFVLRVL